MVKARVTTTMMTARLRQEVARESKDGDEEKKKPNDKEVKKTDVENDVKTTLKNGVETTF